MLHNDKSDLAHFIIRKGNYSQLFPILRWLHISLLSLGVCQASP